MRPTKLLLGLSVAMMASSVAVAQTDTLTGSGIRVRKDASLYMRDTLAVAEGRTESYSAGSVDTYAGWTDGNMIHYVIIGDSMEVEIARLAETRASSDEVRQLARMLVTDHLVYLSEDLEMAKDEDLGRVANPNDNTFNRLTGNWNELSGLSGADFDRTFVQRIATKHQGSISAYGQLSPSARDDDLRKLLRDRVSMLERHLNRTREVAGTLGVNLNTSNPSGQTTGSTRYPN